MGREMDVLDARFAVNLRNETVSPAFRKALRVWGYLVPPAGLTAGLRRDLQRVTTRGTRIIVDNGLFDDVTRIAKAHASESKTTAVDLAAAGARLKRDAGWSDFTAEQRATINRLADALCVDASAAQGMSVQDQLALSPTDIVGTEDITAAVWLRAGLNVALLGPLARQIRRCNANVARRATRVLAGLPPRLEYLPVASALDFDTAFQAGQVFGASGCPGLAMGFGAFMADDSLSDTIVIRGRTRRLDRRLPMRYLRTALVARGFWDGWRDATGGAPRHFHFLGLGAPIMMAVVTVAAAGTPLVTFDATSPIRDAVEGTVYSSLGAYLKIRTRRLAGRLASGVLKEWSCPCAFCRSFVGDHPFDYAMGRVWAAQHGSGVTAKARDLQPDGGLFAAYPLLSEPRGGALRAQVSFARSGHNHWVLDQIVGDLRRHGRTPTSLEKHVRTIVEAYQTSTNAKYLGAAVSLAFEIAAGRGMP